MEKEKNPDFYYPYFQSSSWYGPVVSREEETASPLVLEMMIPVIMGIFCKSSSPTYAQILNVLFSKGRY